MDTQLMGHRVWEAVTLEPGDKVIFVTPVACSEEMAAHIKERVAEQLPGVEVVMVTGITQMGVYKPDKIEVAV